MKKYFLKNPMNYTGGKHKLLEQMLPLFPEKINIFYDMFCGGLDVSLNMNAKKIIANDNMTTLMAIHREFQIKDIEEIIETIQNYVSKYNLTPSNQEEYLLAREDYNNNVDRSPLFLYTICCFAFNNQIRFNQSGEFNTPFGRRRWNPSLEKKLRAYCEKIKKIDINFLSVDFKDIKIDFLNQGDFFYADPPYLLSLATYNEGGKWTIEKEKELLSFLEELNKKNIKFALSNLLESKGKIHPLLEDWIKVNSFNLYYLNASYKGVSYHRDDSNIDQEVLITNYINE